MAPDYALIAVTRWKGQMTVDTLSIGILCFEHRRDVGLCPLSCAIAAEHIEARREYQARREAVAIRQLIEAVRA